MILVVSPGSPAGLLLELNVSVTLESLDDRVQDDDEGEELDSSTGAALLPSSPQATSPMATQASIAGNANRFISAS